jgi:hypothetical protein
MGPSLRVMIITSGCRLCLSSMALNKTAAPKGICRVGYK